MYRQQIFTDIEVSEKELGKQLLIIRIEYELNITTISKILDIPVFIIRKIEKGNIFPHLKEFDKLINFYAKKPALKLIDNKNV